MSQTWYEKLPLAARCCHLPSDNKFHERQTNERTYEQKDIANAFVIVGLTNKWSWGTKRPASVALLVASRYALPGYGDRRVWFILYGLYYSGRIIVSGYSGVCFEIKFSGRHTGFDGVLFNLWPLANTGFRDAQYWSLLKALITDGILLYALAGHQWLCSHAPPKWTLRPTVRGALELWPSIMQ